MASKSSSRPETPLKEEAHAKLLSMGTAVLFEKVLTGSDASGNGRIVIPKGQAESHFPEIEAQTGQNFVVMDTYGKKHTFRFRFWINNASRMYLLENTQDVLNRYAMQAGDVLIFSRSPEGQYCVCGRQGTKEDVSRKTATKRLTEGASSKRGGKTSKQPHTDLARTKRMKSKHEASQVQSVYSSYWSGYSLPPRRDGVFRAVPNASGHETGKVMAQCGCWTAIVDLCGEAFQAFFETAESAAEALEAALHAPPMPPPPMPPPLSLPAEPRHPLAPRASLGQLAEAAAMMPGLSHMSGRNLGPPLGLAA